MAKSPIVALIALKDQINNLGIDDQKAKELESLLRQAIQVIQQLPAPKHDFFISRRKQVLDQVHHLINYALPAYWNSKSNAEKIAHFSNARTQTTQALSLLLSCFKE